jgi:hypothetical protein
MNKWYLYQYIYISASFKKIFVSDTFEKSMNHKNFIKKMNSNKHKLRHACLLFHVI